MAHWTDEVIAGLKRHRPVRYMLVGAFNTACSFGVYCLGIWHGFSVPLASLIAIVLGIALSFTTQGAIVFGHLSAAAFARFLLTWTVMYGLHVSVVTGLSYFGVSAYVGGFVAMAITTTISYFVLRDRVFRKTATARVPPANSLK